MLVILTTILTDAIIFDYFPCCAYKCPMGERWDIYRKKSIQSAISVFPHKYATHINFNG